MICKSRGCTTTEQGWWEAEGDTYCFDCTVRISRELPDVVFSLLLTAEQVITRMEWGAAGIGVN